MEAGVSLTARLKRLEATATAAGAASARLVAAADLAARLDIPLTDARWRLEAWLVPWVEQCCTFQPPQPIAGRARLTHALAGGLGLTAEWLQATCPILDEPCTSRSAFVLRLAVELAVSLAEAHRRHAEAVACGAYLHPCPECGEPESGFGWCNTHMRPWSDAARAAFRAGAHA
jgi:hypothetical protein